MQWDKEEAEKLSTLQHRIAEAERKTAEPEAEPPTNQAAMAWRVVTEMLAGVVVGAGMGYMLDQWLGSTPWGFILCFFLGVAGSGMTIYRSANQDR